MGAPELDVFDWTSMVVLFVAWHSVLYSSVSMKKISSVYKKLGFSWLTIPGWIFGPIWLIMNSAAWVSHWLYVFWINSTVQSDPEDNNYYNAIMILFLVTLALNKIWTPLFFGMKWYLLALFDAIIMFFAVFSLEVLLWISFVTENKSNGLLLGSAIALAPCVIWYAIAAIINLDVIANNTFTSVFGGKKKKKKDKV